MKRPTIVSIVGTRPEAIKMAPVALELQKRTAQFQHVLLSTAQHRQMLQQVFESFHIKPDVDLGLMEPNQTLAGFASRALSRLAAVFAEIKPDLVLVQGDTTTVMSATIAAFYQRIRVGHVEAGLRTLDRQNPFPEEVNRRIVSVAADYHFAPTENARQNLLREGVAANSIYVTGNTVVDALRIMPLADAFEEAALSKINFQGRRVIMVTAHRRENHGAPLRDICQALFQLVQRFDDVEIVYPVHLNPNVQQAVRRELADCDRIHLVPPLGYSDMLRLIHSSHFVLTDSGGIQEEAPSFHKPVLIMRQTTERPEVVEAGAGRLVGTDVHQIVTEASRLLADPAAYARMACVRNPFGDGYAAQRIVEIVARELGQGHDGVPDNTVSRPANTQLSEEVGTQNTVQAKAD